MTRPFTTLYSRMGYGGPRFEFFTLSQWKNHEEFIRKDDAARVADIARRREQGNMAEREHARWAAFRAKDQQEAQRQRESIEEEACAERRRLQEEQRAAKRGPKMSPADRAALRAQLQRTVQLAKPKTCPEPQYGGAMYGRCMHQRGRTVEYPEGRNGMPYCPGVDRDRIVPQRQPLDVLPPWIGSYSTHLAAATDTARQKDNAHLLGTRHLSTRERADRVAAIQRIKGQHSDVFCANSADASVGQFSEDVSSPAADSPKGHEKDDDDVSLVFSHATSNGPICATGAQHMGCSSTKKQVELHLSMYKGSMTAPSASLSAPTRYEDLTLEQLTDQIVRLQGRARQT